MSLLLEDGDVQRWFASAEYVVDRAVRLALDEMTQRAEAGNAAAQIQIDSWTRKGAIQDLKRRFVALDQQLVANGIVDRTQVPNRASIRQPDGSRQMGLFTAMTRAQAQAFFDEQQAQVVTRQRVLGVLRRIFETWDQHAEIDTLGEAAALAGVDLHVLMDEAVA